MKKSLIFILVIFCCFTTIVRAEDKDDGFTVSETSGDMGVPSSNTKMSPKVSKKIEKEIEEAQKAKEGLYNEVNEDELKTDNHKVIKKDMSVDESSEVSGVQGATNSKQPTSEDTQLYDTLKNIEIKGDQAFSEDDEDDGFDE